MLHLPVDALLRLHAHHELVRDASLEVGDDARDGVELDSELDLGVIERLARL